jgi:hypothetical protein
MKNTILIIVMLAAVSTGAMGEWVELGSNGKITQYAAPDTFSEIAIQSCSRVHRNAYA